MMRSQKLIDLSSATFISTCTALASICILFICLPIALFTNITLTIDISFDSATHPRVKRRHNEGKRCGGLTAEPLSR